MRIRRVSFADFRSYERFDLEDVGPLTVFVGPNAAGKTNILEGVSLLTSAQSFRHPQISQVIREGAQTARLSADISDGNRRIETTLLLEKGKKRFLVNGKPKASADVRGLLPSVTFTPDDLELAKKSSSVKRLALDDLGSQLNRNYYIVRRDYEKTVRYKNRLLKEDATDLLIDSIDDTLIACGSQLFMFRRALFRRLLPHMVENYASIARDGETFSASYLPSWDKVAGEERESGECSSRDEVRVRMHEALVRHRAEERSRHRALVGPHNDQVAFALAGRDASQFASQGQQRSIVLAWKLAEVSLTREMLEVAPVLLLDDVLSELDEARRAMLLGFVTEDVQTFVTATDLSGFAEGLVERARVVNVG